MKKAIAISFLLIYLFSTTELSQLLKLPAFVSHFSEHRDKNPKITLWQFLYMHYKHSETKDSDYEKDMQLPFKTHDNCAAQINVVIPPSDFTLTTSHVHTLVKIIKYVTDDVTVMSSFLANIWQPPKSC